MLSKKSDDISIAATTPPLWRASLRANWTVPVALLLLWPIGWFVHDSGQVDNYVQRILMLIGVNVILAVSLQLINGISGQFSLGHAGFMAVGAYTTGYILKTVPASAALPEPVFHSLCLLGGLAAAGLTAAVAGLIVGLPTLRLRGDYLAIATLGFGEIIRVVITNTPALGAATGMTGIPPYTNFTWLYGAVIITVVCVWRIARSARGRNLAAVREDEIAASAVGIDTTYHKVLAFVVGAFFAGVAGGLFASLSTYINPSEFGFLRSVEIVVMVTLGGLGSISGATATAAVLTLLPEILRDPPSAWPWGVVIGLAIAGVAFYRNRRRGITILIIAAAICLAWELIRWLADRYNVELADFRMVIYSSLLIGMMLLRPQGLLGNRELWPPGVWWQYFFRRAPLPPARMPHEPGQSPALEYRHDTIEDR